MHHIDVKIMDTKQCRQTLEDKFADSLPNYNTNTLCGFSDIDQCRVRYIRLGGLFQYKIGDNLGG